MSTMTTNEGGSVRMYELRRFQVFRLDRPRRRSLLQRLRRTIRAHLPR
jgi:hypothetical protein